ncbi:MAG TPA: hypothetical protein VGL32_10120 [Acidimicrobiales bacterium]
MSQDGLWLSFLCKAFVRVLQLFRLCWSEPEELAVEVVLPRDEITVLLVCIHPKAVQSPMGHSSITVTLDRYGHFFPELDEALVVSFGERLAAACERRPPNVVHSSFGSS